MPRNTPPASADDPILRRVPAAEYLGIGPQTLDRLTSAGKGPRRTVIGPRAIGYRRSALNEWASSLENTSNE